MREQKRQPDKWERNRRDEAKEHLEAVLGVQGLEGLRDLIKLEVEKEKAQADLTHLASKTMIAVFLLAISLPVLAGVVRLCMFILGL